MDNTPSINDKELIIDLDKLNSTQSLGAEEYIRKDIIIDIVNKIDSTVKSNIDNIERSDYSSNSASLPIAQHPCFFIHGERGSGKSTLLRGIIEALNNENRFGLTRLNAQKIELLTYVDPTEFAKGENFFIYILSKIADRLKEQKKTSAHAYDSPYSFQDKRKEKHKKIIELFQDMAEGLKFIQDTKESLHKSEDAAFFFEDYVSKCSSSAQLKQKFAELLEEMCELEHVDAYVVAIDDADINFGKCSEIMETVRNYMIAPRLVILFAGDMKLYSLVARDTHIERFSPTSLQHDTSRTPHRNTLLEQLEDQYLLKLFPVHGRAYLGSFYELLQSHGSDSRIVTLKHPRFTVKSVQLQDFLNACMKVLVSDNTEQVTQTFLASQPMRSMLQLLNLWANTLTLGQDADNKITISNNENNISHLTRALSMAFSQALIQNRVDFTLISQGDYGSLIKNVLLHVARLGGKLSHTRLLADAGDESERKVSFYLNAEVLHNTTSYSRQLKYMFYVFPLIQFINNEDLKNADKQSNKVKEIDDIERFALNTYDSSYGEKYDEWGAWCTALLAPNPDSGSTTAKRYGTGAIRVNKKGKNGLLSIQTFARELCDNAESDDLFPYAIYHSLCIVTNSTGTGYYLSIFNIITLIQSILDINSDSDDELRTKINNILSSKTDLPSATHLLLEKDNKSSSKASSPRDDDEEGSAGDGDSDAVSAIFKEYFKNKFSLDSHIDAFYDWYTKYKDLKDAIISSTPCFAYSLEKCWRRFYSRCSQVTEKARLSSTNEKNATKAGELFVGYMEALTNAIASDFSTSTSLDLRTCINDFPLWKAITNVHGSKTWEYFNQLNIGATIKANSAGTNYEYDQSTCEKDTENCTALLKFSKAVDTMLSMLIECHNAKEYSTRGNVESENFITKINNIKQQYESTKGEIDKTRECLAKNKRDNSRNKLTEEGMRSFNEHFSRSIKQIKSFIGNLTKLTSSDIETLFVEQRQKNIMKNIERVLKSISELEDKGLV